MTIKPIPYPDPRSESRTVIRSEPFGDRVQYEIKEGHMIMYCGQNGTVALSLGAVAKIAKEMIEIAEVWG